MKRTVKMIALVAIAVGLAFASCQKEKINSIIENVNNGFNNGGITMEWVDLGLPSGLLWAKCNLGAGSPEQSGCYYAWGETTAKSTYTWSTYKYCNDDYDQLTKYCNNSRYGDNGFTDGLTSLQAMDDAAAQALLGYGARTPTKAEWEELINNTTAVWTTMNGVKGRKFTASNGKSLFLPAAGGRWGGGLDNASTLGYYWSSTLDADYPSGAWDFRFGADSQGMGNYYRRYAGFSVRAVR